VLISDFFAYSNVAGAGTVSGFGGGVFVASADFNGDGFAEVVTSPGAGASGHLKVFDFNTGVGFAGNNPVLRTSFFAYPGFAGEVRVATVSQLNGLPLLATASGAGTTSSDLRVYTNVLGIGGVPSGTLVPPAAQTIVFPGFLGGGSIAGGNTGQLFVTTNVGVPQLSAFSVTRSAFGGFAFVPGPTVQTAISAQPNVRLGSADVNGDGLVDAVTSFPGGTVSGISVFSVTGGTLFLPVANTLSQVRGFGFFGGTWLDVDMFAVATTFPTFGGTSNTTAVTAPR
jgi:hypothetical protein